MVPSRFLTPAPGDPAGLIDDRSSPSSLSTFRIRIAETAKVWLIARPLEVVGLSVMLAGSVVAVILVAVTSPVSGLDSTVVGPSAYDWDDTAGQLAASTPTARVGTDHHVHGDAAASGLQVHVAGAVATPGVVVVAPGSRVAQAIAAAGGPRWSADLNAINLAREVLDGEQIVLPFIGDGPSGGQGSPGFAQGKVNINRAGVDELVNLPGIGPTRARAIVEHRDRHGPFRAPGDLRNVAGIGEATFQNLAEQVTVG